MPRQFRSDDTSIWNEGFGNGRDGALTISTQDTEFKVTQTGYTNYNTNSFGGFIGTSGNTYGTVTDNFGFWTDYVRVGDPVIIHQTRSTGMGNWELNVVMGGIPTSGGSSTLILKYPLQNTYVSSAQVIKIPQLSSFTVNSGIRVYSTDFGFGTNTGGIMAVMVDGTFTNNGEIWLDGRGFRRGGTTGGIGSYTDGYRAEGATVNFNSSRGLQRDNQSAGGGKGGVDGQLIPGAGSGGGYATAGTQGGAGEMGQQAEAGNTIGIANLTTLHFGGGGGAAGGRFGTVVQQGGDGGGILLVIAKNFVNNGYILSRGNNGDNGGGNYQPAGGGGAGGSILIKAETATLGSGLVLATGGTGGTGYVGQYGSQVGGNGGVGRIHLDYKTSYSGTTNPTIDVTQDSSLYSRVIGGSFIFNLL